MSPDADWDEMARGVLTLTAWKQLSREDDAEFEAQMRYGLMIKPTGTEAPPFFLTPTDEETTPHPGHLA
jgi:hypothetical protein